MRGLDRSGVCVAGVLAFALAGCSGGRTSGLPAIPSVVAEEFPERARATVTSRIEALAQEPDDPWGNGDLAMILHAHDRLSGAEALYRRAAALSGGEFRWTYLLGVAQQEAGRYAEAADSLRGVLKTRQYIPAAIRLAEVLAALQSFDEATAVLGSVEDLAGSDAAKAYGLGRLLVDRGQAAEALPLLERAVRLAPESGAARYSLGLAQRAVGDEVAAQRTLGSVRTADDSKPVSDDPLLARVQELAADEHFFLNLGRSLEAKGALDDAIRAYEEALSLDPRMASAHANLVGAYGRAGSFAKAAQHYEAARSIDSSLAELHNNWGVVQATREDPSAAAAAFRQAIELNPLSAEAHANLGVALLQLGEVDEAARHFREAVASDSTNPVARMNLGTLALEAGRPDEAVTHLEVALAGDAGESEAFVRYALSHAYRRVGRDAEAEEAMLRALRLAEGGGLEGLAASIRGDIESLPQR